MESLEIDDEVPKLFKQYLVKLNYNDFAFYFPVNTKQGLT